MTVNINLNNYNNIVKYYHTDSRSRVNFVFDHFFFFLLLELYFFFFLLIDTTQYIIIIIVTETEPKITLKTLKIFENLVL